MKQLKHLLTAVAILLAAATANAQLAGKNVLLIHGFKSQHLINPPSDEGLADGLAAWADFEPALTDPATARILYWPSHHRLSGAGGIAALITSQLKPIVESGFCDDQCIIITHSTGDLIARYILANKLSLLGSSLAGRFRVAAVIDMAGAGGGTELADLAVDVINGVETRADILASLTEFAGFDFEVGQNPGVLIDLQTSVARNTAVSNIPAIPRLRIAGTGDDGHGLFTHAIIKGQDDSIVPLHSACGAVDNGAYDSCVNDLRMDGCVTSVSNAPSQSQLYDYHYPIILSASMPHNDMQTDQTGHEMTFALSSADNYNGSTAKSINVDVAYETGSVWWDWFGEYRFITGAEDKTMGRVIAESFE
ncbi:MAG: hypothetical protein PVI54_09480 [Desulfobacteraceae bacterium]|jgi:hypothetical protein